MDLSSFVRRDISGVRKDILPLSGFGILSHALADEIAARNQTREGYFYTTDMEFLEETEPEQPPVLPPRPRQPETIRMDMTLLFKIVQENQESGKALPAGTQKLLERVRTILRTTPQSRAVSAPQAVRRVYVPLPQSAPSAQNTRLTSTVSRQGTPQYLSQNRMQNPLRDPKAPLAVEKMQMPSREVHRASDHAMLFSDVLHRAQDSGLTFAARKGQGGIPSSAQTRTAYTTQALRQAKAEQQAAEEQSIPVWQRTMQKEASQTSTDVSGASWQFDKTGTTQQKTNEISTDNALRTEKLTPALPAQKMPENAVSILQQMAAPRYPEAELNFAQEETPTERAEVPALTAQHPSAENIRAMQETGTKALTESIHSALKEAAPLMTATAQETVQKQAEQAVQAVRASQQKAVQSAPPADVKAQKTDAVQSRTTPQTRQATQPMHRWESAHQARQIAPAVPQRENSQQARQNTPNIPPQSNTTVENRVGKTANAANPDTVSVSGKAQGQHTATTRNAENVSTENVTTNAVRAAKYGQVRGGMVQNRVQHETLEKALPAEQKETSAILTHETAERPETVQKQTADFAEHKTVSQRTAETSAQKSVEQSQRNPGERAEMSGNMELLQTQEQAAKRSQEIIPERNAEIMQVQPHIVDAEESTATTTEIMQSQSQAMNVGAETATAEHPENTVLAQPQNAERKSEVGHEKGVEYSSAAEHEVGTEHGTAAERIPALNGDRTFAEAPENAVSILQQMAAPRYPEAELNFAQEETPMEGAEVPAPTAQHPSAESIRAVQEASAKALTESVRSALKEAAPLMTATAQETVQKQAEQAVQAVRASQQKAAQSALPADAKAQRADTAQSRTAPQTRQATQPVHQQENTHQARQAVPEVFQRENSQPERQTAPSIPPQGNTTVENRAGKTTDAADPDTASVSVPGKAQGQRTAMTHNAENVSTENVKTNAVRAAKYGQVRGGMVQNRVQHETLEKALPAEQKETSDILTHKTVARPETMQRQTAGFAGHKNAPQRTEEIRAQKTVEQSQRNPETRAEMSENAKPFQTQKQAAKQTREIIPERIPALNGDRTFAEAPKNAASILQQMTAAHYPETELNFVQEETPMEGAEVPISTVQHPSAESIRAVQEASAKALTESVQSALKEAAPLMTATAQETTQRQAEQAVQAVRASQQKAVQSAPSADAKAQSADAAQSRTAPQTQQATQPMHRWESAHQARQIAPAVPQCENSQQARQATPNIPPQGNTTVENRVGKTANAANRDTVSVSVSGKAQGQRTATTRNAENVSTKNVTTNAVRAAKYGQVRDGMAQNRVQHETLEKALPAEQKETSAILTHETAERPETMQKPIADFAEHKTVPQRTAETSAQKTVEQSRLNPEERAEISGNAESIQIPAQVAKQTRETIPERIPALNGDRAFAEALENAASILQQMAAARYPETELNFAQEEALMEGAEMPIPTAQHPSAESIRAVQEASAKALTESIHSALKEAAPLMTATAQETVQKQAEQAVRDAVTAVLTESPAQPGTPAQNRLTQKVTEAVNRSIDTALKQSAPQLQQTVQAQEKEKIKELHQTLRQEAVEMLQQAAAESRNEMTAAQKSEAVRSGQMTRQENRTLQNTPDVLDLDTAENAEGRLPPLSSAQTLPGQPAGQNAGQTARMERVVELLRQNGYGVTPLEYRMGDAAPEAAAAQMLSAQQTGAVAEKTLLWLGEKVAANAARELSRMQRTMPSRQNSTIHPGRISRQNQPGQPRSAGSIGYAADAWNTASAERMGGNAGAPYMAGRITAQTLHPTALHTASRPMGIPAEAQWKPGGQTAPAQMVNPSEMPQLMYQTGQSEGAEVPFAPAGSTKHALPQLGSNMEVQSAYPALSMEYSSPMSRMEQQLQSAIAQQMSAASRPMAMQTEAGQYMAGKAAPGGMTTLDQMSAPPVNDQIVWQNPYLRSAPADMTYRNKKKPVEQQPQPAPRPQAVRMSDAEIHRMADQVFRIVKDKIRQERRKMGL